MEVLENNTECERIFCGIVAYIASKDDELDIMDRKCFERKETTDYLKNRLDEIKTFVDAYSIGE